MRKLAVFFGLLLASSGIMAFAAVAGQGAPILLRADQLYSRTDPSVVIRWTDTNSQTVVFTKVRRRSTGADTFWTIRCTTTGRPDSVNATLRARGSCKDDAVATGKTYRYQAADSISGAAVTAWSDSVSITVTDFRRSQ